MTTKATSLLSLFLVSFILLGCSSNDEGSTTIEVDTENPVIKCPDNITITIGATEANPIIDYITPVGTDNVNAITSQIEGLPSGSSFPEGVTTNTFRAADAAGNSTTCSFDVIVTRDAPGANTPYFIGNDPTPAGKKWVKAEELSDEFDGSSLDDTKWHNNPATDPFRWYGRPPALFDPENVSISDGNLCVTVLEYDTPKTANGQSWTHGGAILRSKAMAGPGQYYEARMKANSTVMSSTFWIAFPFNCTTGPTRKLELDVQECVGRVHSGTQSWASEWDNIYHSNTRLNFTCASTETTTSPAKTTLNEKNHSRYFVYGCWWKSPTEIIFYLDGEYMYTIDNPPSDFDIEGHITMAIETYDWNPIDANNILKTGSVEERTTKYDWVRTWKLEDE